MRNSFTRRAMTAFAVAALLTGALVAGAVAQQLLAGAPGQQLAAAGAEIEIKNFAFGPASITVAPGTKVTWLNQDEEPHNIVSLDVQPHKFQSKAMGEEDSFSVVLDQPGTYRYICAIHPFMQGMIVVQ